MATNKIALQSKIDFTRWIAAVTVKQNFIKFQFFFIYLVYLKGIGKLF